MNYEKWIMDIVNKRVKELNKKIEKQISNAYEKAGEEFMPIYGEKLKSLYDESVKEFYDDYRIKGDYIRNNDLYDIFEYSVFKESGAVKLKFWFDEKKMIGFRNGYKGEDGLYDQVVRKGWHGGAGSGPGHPHTGLPYWRGAPSYRDWYRENGVYVQAPIAPKSPLNAFKEKYNEYVKNGLNEEYNAILDKYMSNIQI